jgi:hypothetical protein
MVSVGNENRIAKEGKIFLGSDKEKHLNEEGWSDCVGG